MSALVKVHSYAHSEVDTLEYHTILRMHFRVALITEWKKPMRKKLEAIWIQVDDFRYDFVKLTYF